MSFQTYFLTKDNQTDSEKLLKFLLPTVTNLRSWVTTFQVKRSISYLFFIYATHSYKGLYLLSVVFKEVQAAFVQSGHWQKEMKHLLQATVSIHFDICAMPLIPIRNSVVLCGAGGGQHGVGMLEHYPLMIKKLVYSQSIQGLITANGVRAGGWGCNPIRNISRGPINYHKLIVAKNYFRRWGHGQF